MGSTPAHINVINAPAEFIKEAAMSGEDQVTEASSLIVLVIISFDLSDSLMILLLIVINVKC